MVITMKIQSQAKPNCNDVMFVCCGDGGNYSNNIALDKSLTLWCCSDGSYTCTVF